MRNPGLRRSLSRSRAVGVLALAALVAGGIVGSEWPGSSRGASRPRAAAGAAVVQRRDLVATDTEAGTLSYADARTVFNRLSGTITWLPPVGATIHPGGVLFRVDGAPVVLMSGTVPAYRTLAAGVADGPDVEQLKRNLVALGFAAADAITIDQTFDAATTTAVERWQASLGEAQTGTLTLGQVVFLPGPRRVTAVEAELGSTGGSGGGSGGASGGSAASGAATAAATSASAGGVTSSAVPAVAPGTGTAAGEFVSLSSAAGSGRTASAAATTSTGSTASTASTTSTTEPKPAPAPHPRTRRTAAPTRTRTAPARGGAPGRAGSGSAGSPSTLAALIALLHAETLELAKQRAAASSSARGSTGSASRAGAGTARSGSGSGSGSAGGSGSGGSGGTGTTSSSGGGSAAQAVLETSSTQLVVTVDLDATKQSEATVGEPVSVELPDGSSTTGRITAVSPVAQAASGSSGSGGGGGASSGTPSATVPVTIALLGRRPRGALDQAAVSVNFEQQSARNVLSVPVTALLATAGGGYALQAAAAPHRLIPVTPGLFAAGYVQVSGAGVYPGLAVTDSQG